MIGRRDDQDFLVGAGRQQGLALRDVGRRGAVGEIDALGTACRATGVLQDGERVRLGKSRQRKALAGPSGQPRAGIDHDGPANAELGGQQADQVLQRGIADDRRRLCILKDRTELVYRVCGIERNGLRPGRQDREGCHRGIDRIRHDQRDPPAANLTSQRLGEPGDAGEVLPIGQPLLAAAKRQALRCSIASRGQHVQHGRKDMRHRRRHGVEIHGTRSHSAQRHGCLRGPPAASRSQVLSVTPRSLNLYFCTLPLSVLGNSLTNSR